jgi:hypothetical protein
MSTLRNSQLLQQVGRHPLKSALARCLDISELFAGDAQFLELDKNLSTQGRDNARQAKLRAAIRDLRDARAPIAEIQSKLDAKRKVVAMPKFDRSDDYALKLRMELRQTLKTADTGQRALLLAKPAYADALLETEPEASGLFLAEEFKGTVSAEIQRDRDIVAAAKEKRLAGMFGRELEEIAELEKVVAEANMVADIARNDLQLHSEMEPRVFNEFVKPVESKANALWLKRDKDASGAEVIYVLVPDGQGFRGRIASPDEQRDGHFFQNHSEYLASRAA